VQLLASLDGNTGADAASRDARVAAEPRA
jgi:hypothetical protein